MLRLLLVTLMSLTMGLFCSVKEAFNLEAAETDAACIKWIKGRFCDYIITSAILFIVLSGLAWPGEGGDVF